jgi:hypothetical protein
MLIVTVYFNVFVMPDGDLSTVIVRPGSESVILDVQLMNVQALMRIAAQHVQTIHNLEQRYLMMEMHSVNACLTGGVFLVRCILEFALHYAHLVAQLIPVINALETQKVMV